MPKIEVEGTFDRTTKRMVRYATDWGVIYLPQTIGADGKYPEKIKVTVTPLE